MTLQEFPRTSSFREASTPVLMTERLVLRAPRIEDAKLVATLANDRRIAENTARIPHPYRPADAERFIAAATGATDETVFLITLGDADVIGACGLMFGPGEAPEVGYWLGVPYWGKGYATEAGHALVDHAFTDLDCEALQSAARVSNPASRRVLEKCGFQWTDTGLLRIRALASSAPIDRFRLDRRLWTSLKSWGRIKTVA
jgi:RimJ/RimL family protein N-acetyltransferase